MHQAKNWLKSALILAVASTAMTSWRATAQTTSTAAPPSESADMLQPVVVTANRRSENAQYVPIAVTAISGTQAITQGVINTETLANAVPGLTFTRQTVTATPFLRGVGSPTGQVGDEPSVAFYVDDVYEPEGGEALANFNNIERIEVEKGPQGTLFGRNAVGGVIQVFTKNPTAEPELDVQAGYANYNTLSGSMYTTGQIAPGLLANFAAYGSNQSQGWGRNVTTGAEAYGPDHDYGGRAKLLWQPDSRTSILLNVDFDNTVTTEGFYHPAPGTLAAGLFPGPPGFYDSIDHTNPNGGNKQSGISIKGTEDMDWAKLVSISAYRFTRQHEIIEESGGPAPLVVVQTSAPDTTITQELQLLSPDSDTLNWIGGFFFMSEKAGYSPLTLSGEFFSPYAAEWGIQSTKSYAEFGQITFRVLPDTHITAGLRYTIDDRSESASYDPGTGVTYPAPGTPESLTSSKLTERLSIDHQFTPDVMAYIAFNSGFKSATFNTVVLPGSPIGAPVKPETLDDYSVGLKSEFLDQRLRFNVEGFYYKYKDIQINQLVLGTSVLSNAAAATLKGVDVDITFVPAEHLKFTAAFEGLDGHYTSYPDGILWTYNPGCGVGLPYSNCSSTANLAGDKTIDTPPFSADLTADYVVPTRAGDFDFDVAYNHGGGYFFDPDNGRGQLNPHLDMQPITNIVNMTLGWTSLGGMYDVQLWGRNITDQKYISFGEESSFITAWAPSPPATYGINVGVHFM